MEGKSSSNWAGMFFSEFNAQCALLANSELNNVAVCMLTNMDEMVAMVVILKKGELGQSKY